MSSPTSRRGARRRHALLGSFGALAAVVLAASVAWACTVPFGTTWYDDGPQTKSGPTPANLSVFATGATPTSAFQLVTGTTGDPSHGGAACMSSVVAMNPTTRYSNARGFIATTNGTLNRAPGEWQVCFRQPNGASATSPVIFVVL